MFKCYVFYVVFKFILSYEKFTKNLMVRTIWLTYEFSLSYQVSTFARVFSPISMTFVCVESYTSHRSSRLYPTKQSSRRYIRKIPIRFSSWRHPSLPLLLYPQLPQPNLLESETPSSLPDKLGITSPTALAAPLEVGTILRVAQRTFTRIIYAKYK